MSVHEHDDDCPGCRPAVLDAETGKVMPDNSDIMIVVNQVWAETTLEERQSFHRVTCQNGRDPKDVATIQRITEQIQLRLRANAN